MKKVPLAGKKEMVNMLLSMMKIMKKYLGINGIMGVVDMLLAILGFICIGL